MFSRKNKSFTKLCFLLMIGLLPEFVLAQTIDPVTEYQVRAISTMDGDDVILRWGPTDYDCWNWGNENGYQIRRQTVFAYDTLLSFTDRQASLVELKAQLLPWPEADWEAMADSSDLAGLAASAIHGTGFTIETADPDDLMSVRSVAQEKDNRFGLSLYAADQSFEIAGAMGLALRDDHVEPNHIYEYYIKLLNVPDSIEVHGGLVRQNTDSIAVWPQPPTPKGEPGDSIVQLSWENPSIRTAYTSFNIERSTDGGQTFSKRNDKPILYVNNGDGTTNQAVFIDSLPANGQPYYYRITGVTPFGLLGASSEAVEVIGEPAPLQADIYIYQIREYQHRKLNVRWRFPVELESEIVGFRMYRADSRDGKYSQIGQLMGPGKRSRNYHNVKPVSYYKIVAFDHHNNRISSPAYLGQIVDSIPPLAPQNLAATVTPSGVVSLTWDNNSEVDLAGYRVFISNQADGFYTQITTQWTPDTIFYQQLNLKTLTEKVYFKVLALDHHENNSPFSEYLEVDRPDIIPPAGPVLKNVEARMDGIYLEWDYSPSRDVVKHILQRKLAANTNWETLLELPTQEFDASHLDTTTVTGKDYVYRMLAEDEAGLQGSSRMFSIRPIDNGLRPEITDFQAHINANGKSVYLSWNYHKDETLYDFQIYRSISSNEPLRAYASAKQTETLMALVPSALNVSIGKHVYLDEELLYGKQYEYRIMARYIDGGKSPLSEGAMLVIE